MTKKILMLAAAVGTSASVAMADPATVLTFVYNDLAGSFASTGATTGTFTANAAAITGGVQSCGPVSRQIPVLGTAAYNPGFFGNSPPANVTSSISLTNIDSGFGYADGAGSFQITGTNGATVSGTFVGFFLSTLEGVAFNGSIESVSIVGSQLNGEAGTFIDLAFPGTLVGARTLLLLQTPGFFPNNFEKIPAQFQADIIPTPGTALLAGVGALAAFRRRR